MKHVLITGVSTGIGAATATALIERGDHVHGLERKRPKARYALPGNRF